MNIETSFATPPGLTHPFLRPGNARSPEEQRREVAKRTTSWILVAALHVLVVVSFVISIHPFSNKGNPMVETLLMLPASNANTNNRQNQVMPDIPDKAPSTLAPPPVIVPIIPPPPTPDQPRNGAPTQGDILGMVGRELACAPGSWEHLTGKEQKDVCGGGPWRAYRTPQGNLVMIPPSQLPRLKQTPEPQYSINSGADLQQRNLQIGQDPTMGGCPIIQNSPCIHVTPGYRQMNGN